MRVLHAIQRQSHMGASRRHTLKPLAKRSHLALSKPRSDCRVRTICVRSALKGWTVSTRKTSLSAMSVAMVCTRTVSSSVGLVLQLLHYLTRANVPPGITSRTRERQPVTCIFCRAKCNLPAGVGGARAGGAQVSEGYLNLSGAAGISPVRDTSSCTKVPLFPAKGLTLTSTYRLPRTHQGSPVFWLPRLFLSAVFRRSASYLVSPNRHILL